MPALKLKGSVGQILLLQDGSETVTVIVTAIAPDDLIEKIRERRRDVSESLSETALWAVGRNWAVVATTQEVTLGENSPELLDGLPKVYRGHDAITTVLQHLFISGMVLKERIETFYDCIEKHSIGNEDIALQLFRGRDLPYVTGRWIDGVCVVLRSRGEVVAYAHIADKEEVINGRT